MSIYAEILTHIGEGRLHELVPALPTAPTTRRIVACTEIKDMILGPWDDSDWEVRCNFLRADFDKFLTGSIIPVAAGTSGGRASYLKKLTPYRDEIWEIRSRDPDPSLRIFGRFADKDLFVALSWHKRPDLGGPKTRPWRDAMVECGAEWRKLFPSYDALQGSNPLNFNDYVTNNFPV
jgi:hypothetical protein